MNKKLNLILEMILIFLIGLLILSLDLIREIDKWAYFFGILVQRSFIWDLVMYFIFGLLMGLIILIILPLRIKNE